MDDTLEPQGDLALARRRAAQDYVHKGICANLDLAAQDNHMKYERGHFAVVTASEAYRQGWERIFGNKGSS